MWCGFGAGRTKLAKAVAGHWTCSVSAARPATSTQTRGNSRRSWSDVHRNVPGRGRRLPTSHPEDLLPRLCRPIGAVPHGLAVLSGGSTGQERKSQTVSREATATLSAPRSPERLGHRASPDVIRSRASRRSWLTRRSKP